MKRFLLAILAVVVILVLAVAGCGEQAADNGEIGEHRIISLIPGNTEILFALGLGDAVVGVTDLCDYPPDLELAVAEGRIQRVGDAFTLNEELIISLEPTLVLFGFDNDAAINQFNSLGIATAVIYPQSLSEVLESILTIGELTGLQGEAQMLVEAMEDGFAEIEAKTAVLSDEEKPRVLFILDLDWLSIAGSGSLQGELITLAGGINVIDVDEYPSVSEEAIIESMPDLILCSFPYREQILNEKEAWRNLPAVQNKAIFDLEGDLGDMVTRPTPRLVEGLWQLLAILHPDL